MEYMDNLLVTELEFIKKRHKKQTLKLRIVEARGERKKFKSKTYFTAAAREKLLKYVDLCAENQNQI